MKLSALQQHYNAFRRGNSFRGVAGVSASVMDGSSLLAAKFPAAAFGLFVHAVCCLVSLVLGFRFSRVILFLLFSSPTPSSPSYSAPVLTLHTTAALSDLPPPPPPPPPSSAHNQTSASPVVVGRHGILIRPWPHPDPEEVMRAHRILKRVQREQRTQHGVKIPRPVIAVTPTYARTFQVLHLTGVMHSLMLAPYNLTWVVVDAGAGATNDTASLLALSGLRTIHVPFPAGMPVEWAERRRMDARMRLHALRIIRERRLDGIVVFADDSNLHSTEFFDEIQSVRWVGTLPLGILAHSGIVDHSLTQIVQNKNEGAQEKLPVPIQGPACNSSGVLVGWHSFNTLPHSGNSAAYVGDPRAVLPMKMEWAGFVLNARLLWKEAVGRPGWIRDLDSVAEEEIESPLSLLTDASLVEPLGDCGRKVMVWWLRVEARADSKFPPGWTIDPSSDITVSAKRIPWPEVPTELPSEKTTLINSHVVKHHSKSD